MIDLRRYLVEEAEELSQEKALAEDESTEGAGEDLRGGREDLRCCCGC